MMEGERFVMDHRRLAVLLISYFICILMMPTAYAEKQEWVDSNYDFGKVKRVTLKMQIKQRLYNGINENEMIEILMSKFKPPANVQWVRGVNVISSIKAETGIDLDAMGKGNPQAAEKIFVEHLPRYADVAVLVQVFEYGMGSYYYEGYTYNTTEYQTSYVGGRIGNTKYSGTVMSPVNKTYTISGGSRPVAYSAVRFEVIDLKTQKAVFTRLDDRAKVYKDAFSNTQPKDVFGRIMGSFFDDLSNKLEKRNK